MRTLTWVGASLEDNLPYLKVVSLDFKFFWEVVCFFLGLGIWIRLFVVTDLMSSQLYLAGTTFERFVVEILSIKPSRFQIPF